MKKPYMYLINLYYKYITYKNHTLKYLNIIIKFSKLL